jgi:hypothetical protein
MSKKPQKEMSKKPQAVSSPPAKDPTPNETGPIEYFVGIRRKPGGLYAHVVVSISQGRVVNETEFPEDILDIIQEKASIVLLQQAVGEREIK